MQLAIRHATPADHGIVVAFNLALAEESEGKRLDRSAVEVGVAAVLQDPAKGVYYLAESERGVVGQTMITYEWSDWRNGWFWWIQSVYVVPSARRQGVFRRLYRHIEDEARSRPDVIGLRLYYEVNNLPAIHTYQALGFMPTSYGVLEIYPLRKA
ncbi:MAG: GNAT family N-acetyltransferase [Gemmatales bacterium]|nr:GNAT family N-acetyltransferase [Gemmatales bacterium]MDW8387818.1 GNAT family N-acetyltransferase [Gemmatales bacterium]